MQRLFQPVQDTLKEFVVQRRDFCLVVHTNTIQSGYILKLLQTLDEGVLPDLFFQFVQPFKDAETYVDAIYESLSQQIEGVRVVQQREGLPCWESVPQTLKTQQGDAIARMRALMTFARGLRPSSDGMNLVWVLFPLAVEDSSEFGRFVASLIRHEVPFAWCQHMRLIVRDDTANPVLQRHLQGMPRTQFIAPDLSTKAMEDTIVQDAGDETAPVEQRVQSLLMLGMLDQSHQRHLEAIEKYAVCLEYYSATRNHMLWSLVLNQLGEVSERSGRLKPAQDYFEAALVPALEGQAFPVVLNATLNLGNLHLSQKKWADAEEHYSNGAELAKAMRSAQVLVRCKENLGTCRYYQNDTRGAFVHWQESAALARALDEPGLLLDVLQRLTALYRQAGMRRDADLLDAEIAEVKPRVAGPKS